MVHKKKKKRERERKENAVKTKRHHLPCVDTGWACGGCEYWSRWNKQHASEYQTVLSKSVIL